MSYDGPADDANIATADRGVHKMVLELEAFQDGGGRAPMDIRRSSGSNG